MQEIAGSDEYLLDKLTVREFIRDVRAVVSRTGSPEEAVRRLQGRFAGLLADEDWLPPEYRSEAPESGMGGGIGQWLLFRSGARDLSLFSLVVPPGASTPVHDHLAWGLVGLYAGEQEETVFEPPEEASESLERVTRRVIRRGEFYPLLPPKDDIHAVRTTSEVASVSIHLLANDTGCIWRHSYEPSTGAVTPFRSGYANQECEEDS